MKDQRALLGLVYDADPGAYINAINSALGDHYIDAATELVSAHISQEKSHADAERLTGIMLTDYQVAYFKM